MTFVRGYLSVTRSAKTGFPVANARLNSPGSIRQMAPSNSMSTAPSLVALFALEKERVRNTGLGSVGFLKRLT